MPSDAYGIRDLIRPFISRVDNAAKGPAVAYLQGEIILGCRCAEQKDELYTSRVHTLSRFYFINLLQTMAFTYHFDAGDQAHDPSAGVGNQQYGPPVGTPCTATDAA